MYQVYKLNRSSCFDDGLDFSETFEASFADLLERLNAPKYASREFTLFPSKWILGVVAHLWYAEILLL